MNEKINRLKEIINDSDNIVFFGGAGVSTESGIPDFRGSNGLYNNKSDKPVEYYLSTDCFRYDTEEFFEFYKINMNSLKAKPNNAHYFLTDLEKKGKLKVIITQNIDGLHQKSGSKNVLEIHGTIYKNHCINCYEKYKAEYIFSSKGIPRCKCGGIIKPEVVLYGEQLTQDYENAIRYIIKAKTLIVAGTSLTVEPASSLIRYFKGKDLIIINNDKTPYDYLATLVIHDKLGSVIKMLTKEINN